jgi:hypothetical protein
MEEYRLLAIVLLETDSRQFDEVEILILKYTGT